MAEMFAKKRRKIPISKDDIKKAILKANQRLEKKNDILSLSINEAEKTVKAIESDCKKAGEELKTTYSLQEDAKNKLGEEQVRVAQLKMETAEVKSALKDMSNKVSNLKEENKQLEEKEVILSKSVALLEAKQAQSKAIKDELKAIKKEQEVGEETLSLLAKELNSLESDVEAYAVRRDATEREFVEFTGGLGHRKRLAEGELEEIQDSIKECNLVNGKEMARLDHAIAERLSELEDLGNLINRKKYEYSGLSGKIQAAEIRADDADKRAAYSIKKEQDRVDRIKEDFKIWKVSALDGMAKLKLKGKIENIDRAGLREVLDG